MKRFKIVVPKHVVMWVLFATILIITRVVLFGSYTYLYLLWNLFLAFLPFMISSVLLAHHRSGAFSTTMMITGGILWLLVFPNAPYVVTDLIHIGTTGKSVTLLYDSIMLFVTGWSGLLFGLYSLSHIEEILHSRVTRIRTVELVLMLICLASGFGMYLGRFLRFNSWDIVADPLTLVSSLGGRLFVSDARAHVVGYTLLFSIFIYVSYRAWTHDTQKYGS